MCQTVHTAHAYKSAERGETQNFAVNYFSDLNVVPEIVLSLFLFPFKQGSLACNYFFLVVVDAVLQRNQSELFADILSQISHKTVAYMGSGNKNGVASEL